VPVICAPFTVPLSVNGHEPETLDVTVITTEAADTFPVNCPVLVLNGPVAFQEPESADPVCAIVICAGPLPGTAASLMVPFQVPASCSTDGAVGDDEPQAASASSNARGISFFNCSLQWAQDTARSAPARYQRGMDCDGLCSRYARRASRNYGGNDVAIVSGPVRVCGLRTIRTKADFEGREPADASRRRIVATWT